MHRKYDAVETGHAMSAVLVSLLQALVGKGVLTNAEVRTVLTGAASRLGPHDYGAPIKGAIGFILNDLLPQFPDGGGD